VKPRIEIVDAPNPFYPDAAIVVDHVLKVGYPFSGPLYPIHRETLLGMTPEQLAETFSGAAEFYEGATDGS
jgi:hypothetical protein